MVDGGSSEFDIQIHRRLLDKDPVAPSDLAAAYLMAVFRRLRSRFRWLPDQTLAYDAAVDSILDYAEHPSRYDPARSPLLSYLTMVAAGDLRNMLKRERRRAMREVSLEAVEESVAGREELYRPARAIEVEERRALEAVAAEELWHRLTQVISDPRDQGVLRLMLEGERRTPAYARVLGIEDLELPEQRKIVKRHKDRLKKRLIRLGEKAVTGNPDSTMFQRAFQRAARRSFFVARDLSAYQALREIDDEGLAAFLGCAPETLPRLALCRRPDYGDANFRREVEQIAAYAGVDGARLLHLLQQVASTTPAAGEVPGR